MLARSVFGFLVASTVFACATVPVMGPGNDEPTMTEDDQPARDRNIDDGEDRPVPVEVLDESDEPTDTTESCTDVCTAGVKRCSDVSGGSTEICKKGTNGCARWVRGDDCSAGSSCDKTKNDGTCVEGCVNDAGCNATNLGTETCTSTSGRGRIVCAKVGACYRWKASTSCSPDEVCGGGHCKTAAPACTNACAINTMRCSGSRGREQCTRAATGCTVWTATNSCSPDETCSAGNCN